MNPKKPKEGIMTPDQAKASKVTAKEMIEHLKSRQASKIPLRIDDRTVIYVDPHNATPEYAKHYLDRLNKCRLNTTYN